MAKVQRSFKATNAMESGNRNIYTPRHLTGQNSFIPRQKKFCFCLVSDGNSYSSQSDTESTSTSDGSWTSKFSFDEKSSLSISTDDASHDFISSQKSDTSRGFPSITLNESVDETRSELNIQIPHNDITSINHLPEDSENEDQEDALSISSVECSLQAEPKDSEINTTTSISDNHSIKSDSLVFDHLKVLLSELRIPDNQSPEYHVSWAFESKFSKPTPSERFKDMLIEMNYFEKTGQIMGNDLEFRIQKLRLENQVRSNDSQLPQPSNRLIRNSWSLFKESKPPWKVFGPVKALSSVDLVTVNGLIA